MRRKAVSFLIALALVGATPATPAQAWFNGRGSADGYGTHDWVLDKAIGLAGEQGAWVDRGTALAATDDPDTEGTSKRLHVFYERGIYGGAPSMVAELYFEAVQAYRAGDLRAASKAVGVMSHYYADITNPFHAAAAAARSPLHAAYESAVESYTGSPDAASDWIASSPSTSTADVRRMTVNAAAFSRGFYPRLRASYTATGTIDVALPVVHELTLRVLDRACADLATIVASVPAASKIATVPTSFRVDMSRHSVAWGSTPYASATCRDAAGKPISGVAVTFSWPTSSGVVTLLRYTDPYGVARCYKTLGRDPLGTRVRVTATSTSSGATTTGATWYAATDMLGAGTTGLRTTLSSYHPLRRTTVTARAYARDGSGKPVSGLRVAFVWKYRTKSVVTWGVTDANGVARTARYIGNASRSYRVTVTARVNSGATHTASRTFLPR